MPIKLKKFLLALLAGFGLPVLLFLSVFLWTWGDYQVPATVSNDGQLPQTQANQARLHAERFGSEDAPLIIVIHDGPGGDYRSLLPLQALSKQGYQVLFYDQRGSGLSARVPSSQLSIETSLKDIYSLTQNFANQQPITLIGHGWGGMLATAYVGQHPDQVSQLVLLEPGFLNEEMAALVLPAMSRSSFSFIAKTSAAWIRSMHIKGDDQDARSDFVFSQIREQPIYHCDAYQPDPKNYWRAGFGSWKMITQSTFDKKGKLHLDFTKGLKSFQSPVLILASSCNQLTGKSFQARQQKIFTDAQMQVVKDSGHEFMLDQPQQTLALITDYLKPAASL